MNWITMAVVGAVAAWFEYNYQRSRRKKPEPEPLSTPPVPESAHVESVNSEPSIVPGDQNDKQMNAVV